MNEVLNQEVRVRFDFDIVDGFPPIGAEFLIGNLVASQYVKLDNTPFFVEGVALGDVVNCSGELTDLTFNCVFEESGNKAVSIIFIDDSFADTLYQKLKKTGCYVEYGEFPEYSMLAVCIFVNISYAEVKSILDEAAADGLISYAELCIKSGPRRE